MKQWKTKGTNIHTQIKPIIKTQQTKTTLKQTIQQWKQHITNNTTKQTKQPKTTKTTKQWQQTQNNNNKQTN